MDDIDTAEIAQLIDLIRQADGIDCGEAEDALVAIGAPAVPSLLAAELPYPARYRIWRALGRIGDPSAIPTLVRALTPEPGGLGEGVQSFAAEARGRIGEPALKPLLEGLDSDNAELRR
jgi:HEAT repeat protein